jgi:hypothetical protein
LQPALIREFTHLLDVERGVRRRADAARDLRDKWKPTD